MSAQHTTLQAEPSIEDVACETADNLLMDALDAIPAIAPRREIGQAEAILAVGHAVIAKLDATETARLQALRDLRESIDFLSKTLLGQ